MQDWRPYVFGGFASVTAECVTFPIDTAKTRLQVQGQCIDKRLSSLKYRGMLHCFSRVASQEGIRGLYSGLCPAVLRQASYGTIKIGIYHNLKRHLYKDTEETLGKNVLCGIVAGVVSSSIANPTDVLKIRMQARTDPVAHMSLGRAFIDISRREGVKGLWRGVGPTANRAAVVVGVELPAYDVIKKKLLRSGRFDDKPHTHLISSFIAGFLGAVASNPIDVAKTRLMNQRNLKTATSRAVITGSGGVAAARAVPKIYRGAIDCIAQTVRHEGVMALYKGFIPNWLRLGPWNIVFFLTLEQLQRMPTAD